MPLFSILIPTYNRAALLEHTLASLSQQTFTDFETIVVDDGSTDETHEVLARYGDRLRVYHQFNRGPGSARNLGLKHARGEYTVFLDSDDLFLPWTLESYAAAIDLCRHPALILSKPHKFRDEASFISLPRERLMVEPWADFLKAVVARYQVNLAAAIRTDVIRQSGGFVERNIGAEDQDLFLRLGTVQGFAYIQSPTVYGYRQHDNSQSRDLKNMLSGARYVLENDKKGLYAGGNLRRRERDAYLARKFRYNIRRCFETGHYAAGFKLFIQSLPYYLRSGYRREVYRLPLSSFHYLLRKLSGRRYPNH